MQSVNDRTAFSMNERNVFQMSAVGENDVIRMTKMRILLFLCNNPFRFAIFFVIVVVAVIVVVVVMIIESSFVMTKMIVYLSAITIIPKIVMMVVINFGAILMIIDD